MHSHFAAPWQYDGDRGAAIGRLVDVATGGTFTGGDAAEAISRLDAAGYIFGGVAAVVQGVRSGSAPNPRLSRSLESDVG